MKTASLRWNGLTGNTIFDSASPTNLDNCFAPDMLLSCAINTDGILRNTADINASNRTDIELHQAV